MGVHKGLPVEGYQDQSEENVALVNCNKQIEERILRIIDALAQDPETSLRWLAIGRQHIEEGFMAINRSIFRPQRVAIPDPE